GALAWDGGGAKRGARGGGALEHDAMKFDRGFGPRLQRDLHHASLDRRSFVVALDIVAADHVENDVCALAVRGGLGRGDEIFALIVNGDVGPKPAARVALLRGAGSDDHARAE